MRDVKGKRVAIVATDGFERSELMEPKTKLAEAGAMLEVLAPNTGEIRSWDKTDWGDAITVDRKVEGADIENYDALVIPGGVINADHLRLDPAAVTFVRHFLESASRPP